MHSLNTILKEIKDVPVNRLEEVYQFVRSLIIKKKPTESVRNKILSFGGAFSDMSTKDYADYLNQTKKTREKFFERNIEL